ncbi:MAG TPA: hypothetical protein DCS93_30735 [Microscillaceae bacterium]|nr:hypothetical protein [Microscillaceae bacterium]
MTENDARPQKGIKEFYNSLYKRLCYPREAMRLKAEGEVCLEFTVDKDGSLTDIEVISGIGNGYELEAVRLLKKSPKWIPGLQRGKPLKMRKRACMSFKLN